MKVRNQYRENAYKGENTSEYLLYAGCSIKKDSHNSKSILCAPVACLVPGSCGTQLMRESDELSLRYDRVLGGRIQF